MLNSKISNTIILILLAAILLSLFIMPEVASAAVDTPDELTIAQVDVYTGVVEDGDQLYIITYDITYTGSPPGQSSSDLFLIRLMDSTNVQLGVVYPAPYYNNGYSSSIAGIYFTAGQVDALGMTFDPTNGYYMRLAGNPMIAWSGGTPPYQDKISFANYYDDNIQDTLHTRLSVEVAILENEWDVDLIEGPAGDRTLTTYGQEYMTDAIPNLRVICPSIFPAAITRPDMTDTEIVSDFFIGGDNAQYAIHGNTIVAQTFTASLDYELDRLAIKASNTGTPADVTVSLYTTSIGTPNAVIESGTISGTDFLASPAADWEEAAMTPYEVEKDTIYAIVVACSSGTINWRYDSTSTYTGNSYYSTDGGGTWTEIPNADFQFISKAKDAFDMSYLHRLEHQLDGTIFDSTSAQPYIGFSSVWTRTLIWLVMMTAGSIYICFKMTFSPMYVTPFILFLTSAGYFIGFVDPVLALGLVILGGLLTIYMTLFNRSPA